MDQANVARLVAQAQNGDRAAFRALMELHQVMAYRVAYQLTGQYDAAEAVTQDTFVHAYRSLRTFRGRSLFSTWLYSILVRRAADHHRDRQRSARVLSLEEQPTVSKDARRGSRPSVAEELEGRELAELMRTAMANLPAAQRAALVLIAHEGLSYREAAAALGCSQGTVAWRVWNARRLLRERLKAHI